MFFVGEHPVRVSAWKLSPPVEVYFDFHLEFGKKSPEALEM